MTNKGSVKINIEFRDVILKDLTLEEVEALRDLLLQVVPQKPQIVHEYLWPYWQAPWQYNQPYWQVTGTYSGDSTSDNTLTISYAGDGP